MTADEKPLLLNCHVEPPFEDQYGPKNVEPATIFGPVAELITTAYMLAGPLGGAKTNDHVPPPDVLYMPALVAT
jgi:hypothetical protein